MSKVKEIPYNQEELKELLDYDPLTGVLLWKERDIKWLTNPSYVGSWNSKHANKRAGYEKTCYKTGYKTRYLKLPFSGSFLEARIIWVWMKGGQPPPIIDHDNRNATDNSWNNLLSSDRDSNMLNLSKYKSNTSGVSGVFWCKQHNKWRACVNYNGKRYHLGRFDSLTEAAKVVGDFRQANGFNKEHGKEGACYLK